MLAKRFIPHSVYILTNGGTTQWVDQVDGTNPDSGVGLFEESAGSETDREFVAARDIAPTMPFGTSDLSLLTTIGMSGVLIDCASGKPGITMFGRELPLGALPTAVATANHVKMICSDGLLVPVSVRASHNGVAKLSCMLHGILGTTATYSGATPFVFTNSQAITAGAGAVTKLYTTGPVKFTVSGGSSSLVQGISDIAVSFGIMVNKESTDGDVYPSHIAIIGRMPKIEFTTKDPQLIATIGDGVSVSAFAAYFRQVASSGQRTAPATATHCSVAGTAGMVTPGSLSLQHKSSGSASFTYTPTKNTNTLVLSATAAIPTT